MESPSPLVLAFSFVGYLIVLSKVLSLYHLFQFDQLLVVIETIALAFALNLAYRFAVKAFGFGHEEVNGIPVNEIARQPSLSQAYPLTQLHQLHGFTLHAILTGSTECEQDIFKRMAEQCPRIMLETDNFGHTPLHRACISLGDHLGNYSIEICKYLIEQCPASVRMMDNYSRLPIHMLLCLCQHQPVKEVVVCLLQEYPESFNIASGWCLAPSTIPFIQRIKPLLDEERELGESVAELQQVSGVFQDAVGGTDNPTLASSTYIVFDNWAKSFAQDLEARMEQISTQLQDECNVDEEDDREHAVDE